MQSDVTLMIRNAQMYNAEGSQVHLDASKLSALFTQARARIEGRPTSAGQRGSAHGTTSSPGDSPTPGTPQALSAGPFACPVCGQMFTRQSNATRHTRLVHGPGSTEYDGSASGKVQPLRYGFKCIRHSIHAHSASDSKYPAAAVRILREARGTAMHYRDITTRALALGLIVATGKTPESTMNGQLNTSPGFVANGKGYYVRSMH